MTERATTLRRGAGHGIRGAAAVAAAALFAGCGPPGGGGAEALPAQDFSRVINVEVEQVAPRTFAQTLRLPGGAMAMRDVVVSAEESGVVRRIVRDKGVAVTSGQAIVRIDDEVLRAQVEAAAAQSEYARQVWERRRQLFENDGIGPELTYIEARHNAEQSAANLRALQARLTRTTVAAPINGILEDRRVEIGTLVAPGMEVARIVQTDTMRIMASAPERWALHLPLGAPATVTFHGIPGEWYEGRISYVGAVVDPDSRTFPIELELANPEGRIKPGMIAEVSVVQEEIAEAVVVSQDALVAMEDGQVVYVVEGGGDEARAVMRRVRIGVSQGNDVVIDAGLDSGDMLVVVGQQGLTDQDRVRIVGTHARLAGAEAPGGDVGRAGQGSGR